MLDITGVVMGTLRGGVTVHRDQSGYRVTEIEAASSDHPEAAQMKLRFFEFPGFDDHFIIEIMVPVKNDTYIRLTVPVSITGSRFVATSFNPAIWPSDTRERYQSLKKSASHDDLDASQAFDFIKTIISHPDLREGTETLELTVLAPDETPELIQELLARAAARRDAAQRAKAADQKAAELRSLLRTADQKLKDDKYGEAVADYTAYLQSVPDHMAALRGRAEAYEELDQFPQAYADFERLFELDPDDSNPIYDKGISQFYNEDYARAIDTFTRVINHPKIRYSTNAERLRLKAMVALKRYDEALEDVQTRLEELPDSVEIRGQLSDIHAAMGAHGKAVIALNGILKNADGLSDHDLRTFRMTRANLFHELGLYEQEIEELNAFIADGLESYGQKVYLSRARAYQALGQPHKAISDLNVGMARISQDREFWLPEFYWQRGYYYLLVEDFAAAIEDFTSYLDIYGDSAPAYQNRAYAYQKLGKHDLADADIARYNALK